MILHIDGIINTKSPSHWPLTYYNILQNTHLCFFYISILFKSRRIIKRILINYLLLLFRAQNSLVDTRALTRQADADEMMNLTIMCDLRQSVEALNAGSDSKHTG